MVPALVTPGTRASEPVTESGNGDVEPPAFRNVTFVERLQTGCGVARQKWTDVLVVLRPLTDTPGVSAETVAPRRFCPVATKQPASVAAAMLVTVGGAIQLAWRS